MPDEVIEVWLVPHAQRAGWPPTKSNYWWFILGRDRDLDDLKRLRWQRETLALTPTMLAPRHLVIVGGLVQTYVLKKDTIFSEISDGADRFRRCCDFLKERGVFPRPVTLERTATGLDVLDGHHRLTAFFFLYGYFEIDHPDVPCLNVRAEQDVWVAEATGAPPP